MSLRATIILALAAAGVSCGIMFIAGDERFGVWFRVSILFSTVWFVTAVYAVRRFGKAGWRTMLGLVPALYGPHILFVIIYECWVNNACL